MLPPNIREVGLEGGLGRETISFGGLVYPTIDFLQSRRTAPMYKGGLALQ